MGVPGDPIKPHRQNENHFKEQWLKEILKEIFGPTLFPSAMQPPQGYPKKRVPYFENMYADMHAGCWWIQYAKLQDFGGFIAQIVQRFWWFHCPNSAKILFRLFAQIVQKFSLDFLSK